MFWFRLIGNEICEERKTAAGLRKKNVFVIRYVKTNIIQNSFESHFEKNAPAGCTQMIISVNKVCSFASLIPV